MRSMMASVGHVDLQHHVELDAGGLHGVGLRDGAREAVEQEAVGAVGLRDAFLDQADDDVVADQAAASITFLAARPSGVPALTAARSMSPVEICGNAVLLADERGLRAFAGAGGAQQDQSHGFLGVLCGWCARRELPGPVSKRE
jgi:hypothetical protein